MAERKSQNKYYPPDWDPRKGSVNKRVGQHPLRDRARKLHLGIMVIRFEMPFNVWCEGCKAHIGKGVRYNAEKKKTGNYYSTPIYQFSMKCHLCSQVMIIETDPKACDYNLVSGVKKKNETWDPEASNVIPLPDDEEKARLASDPMFRLEHTAADQAKAAAREPSLLQLIKLQEGTKHDYDRNAALRKEFRVKRKQIQAEEKADQAFLDKYALDIKLLPQDAGDKALAESIAFDKYADRTDKLAAQKVRAASGSIFKAKLRAGSSSSVAATAARRRDLLDRSRSLGFSSLGHAVPSPAPVRAPRRSAPASLAVEGGGVQPSTEAMGGEGPSVEASPVVPAAPIQSGLVGNYMSDSE